MSYPSCARKSSFHHFPAGMKSVRRSWCPSWRRWASTPRRTSTLCLALDSQVPTSRTPYLSASGTRKWTLWMCFYDHTVGSIDRQLDAVTGCAVTSLIQHWLNTATNTQLSLRGYWKFPHPCMKRFFTQVLLAQVYLYFPDSMGELSCAFFVPISDTEHTVISE